MENYGDYLKKQQSLPFEEANAIYEKMISQIDLNHEDMVTLWENVIRNLYSYYEYRKNWFLWDREKCMDKDNSRSSSHDTYINSLNALSRFIVKQGGSAEWRERLGDDRRRIGDFGCFMMYIVTIGMR